MRSLRIPAAIFLSALMAGFIAGNTEPVFQEAASANHYPSFIGIFTNNVGVLLILILGGLIFLAISTFFTLLINGFVLGIVISTAIRRASLVFVTVALLPHGVFEIAGFLIAGQIGFELAGRVYSVIADKHQEQSDDESINDEDETNQLYDLFKRILLSFILILIGAIIETTLTPYLMGMLA